MKDTVRIHAIYIVAILVACNIVTLTVKWGDLKELVSYFSFAATLASLLLAILAIVYSYLSGGSIAAYTEKVEAAGKRLDVASECVQQATAKFSEATQGLPAAFKNLDEKVSRTHDLVTNLSASAAEEKAESIDVPPSEKSVSLVRLAVGASPLGQLSMLIACLAFRSKKPFRLAELLEGTSMNKDYVQGWMMALDAADIIDVKIESSISTVVTVPDGFEELLEIAIKDRIEDAKLKKEWRADFETNIAVLKERLSSTG
jgi:hypothetical protein